MARRRKHVVIHTGRTYLVVRLESAGRGTLVARCNDALEADRVRDGLEAAKEASHGK